MCRSYGRFGGKTVLDAAPRPASEVLVRDFDVIVIGGSAGAIEASIGIVGALPPDLPAAVFVVIHIPPDATSRLPTILGRHAQLPVAHATDGEPLVPGRVLVAPPDRHITVTPTHVEVRRGPKENRHRPAIDPLLRSAADAFGPRVIAVILSGGPGDGVSGCLRVVEEDGLVLVQDPADAVVGAMPESILDALDGHARVPLDRIGAAVVDIVRSRDGVGASSASSIGPEEGPMPERVDPAEGAEENLFGCPDCGGVLTGTERRETLEFACQVGHRYTAAALVGAQDAAVERALWSAVRGFEEKEEMLRRLADRVDRHPRVSHGYRQRAEEAAVHAEVIRDLLTTRSGTEMSEEDLVASAD
jgi:two-component system chemotaxis response regulator CheB